MMMTAAAMTTLDHYFDGGCFCNNINTTAATAPERTTTTSTTGTTSADAYYDGDARGEKGTTTIVAHSSSDDDGDDDDDDDDCASSVHCLSRTGHFFRKYFCEGQQVKASVKEQALNPDAHWWQRHRKLLSIIIPVLLVWGFWFPFMAVGDRWYLFGESAESSTNSSPRWLLSLTMVFGSFVAGSTSEGGAAVAFPVMTLALGVPPSVARDFSFMIQSVGMVSAAFSITVMRIKVEWRSVLHMSVSGVAGLIFSLELVAPRLSPPYAKMYFVMIWSAFAFSLFWLNRLHGRTTFPEIPDWEGATVWRWKHSRWLGLNWKATVLHVFGFMGGLFSGIAGSGIDICSFACLTLLFRVSEKTATPTSVILMGINTVVGFLWREFGMGGVEEDAWPFLWVCMPIVVVGAPLGAICGSYLHRLTLAWLIYIIDAVQLIGALAIVRPWLSKANGGVTDTPALLSATSAILFCGGALFFKVLARLGLRLMEQALVKQQEASVDVDGDNNSSDETSQTSISLDGDNSYIEPVGATSTV